MSRLAHEQSDGDGTPDPELPVRIEKICGDIHRAVAQRKDEWLAHHMAILLGPELAAKATTEPAVVRSIMKERQIWLKDEGATMKLMQGDKVVSTFILEIKR